MRVSGATVGREVRLSRGRRPLALAAATTVAYAIAPVQTLAQTATWHGTTSSYWFDSNWSPAPPAAGEVALFWDVANRVVSLNSGSTTGIDTVQFSADAGAYLLQNGTLQLQGSNRIVVVGGSADHAITMSVIFTGDGALQNYGSGTLTLSGLVTSTISPTTVRVEGGGTVAVTGEILGQAAVAVGETTPGTLILTGTNTYTGGTSVFSGATLKLGDGTSTGTVAGNINTDGSVVFNPGAGGQTFGGIIGGAGSLTKTGAGTLTLTGANTYTGPTVIKGGVLEVAGLGDVDTDGGTALGQASVDAANLVIDGGTLRSAPNNIYRTERSFTLGAAGGTLDGGDRVLRFFGIGPVAYSDPGIDRTLTLDGSFNSTISLDIGDAGEGAVGLTKAGTGTWLLGGTSTYSGPTEVLGGLLYLGTNGASSASAYTIAAGAKLSFGGYSATLGSLAGDGTVEGPTGVAISRTLIVGADGTSTTFSGTIVDYNSANNERLAFTKTGAGTLVLSGINGYTGATTVSGGVLRVDGSLAAGSPVTVNEGAALGGTGTVQGVVSLASGATLAPGASAGTLTLGGDLQLLGDASFDFELGAVSDLLVIGGTIVDLRNDPTAPVLFHFSDAGGLDVGTYSLIEFGSTNGLAGLSFAYSSDDPLNGYFATQGNTLQFVVTAVPEPGAMGLLALLASATLRRRRR